MSGYLKSINFEVQGRWQKKNENERMMIDEGVVVAT